MNQSDGEKSQKIPGCPTLINAFQLIGMSSYLDLSGFFEKEVNTLDKFVNVNSNLTSNKVKHTNLRNSLTVAIFILVGCLREEDQVYFQPFSQRVARKYREHRNGNGILSSKEKWEGKD